MEFYNYHARLSQPFKIVNTLHKMLQLCDNLTKLWQGCYKLEIFIWVEIVKGPKHIFKNLWGPWPPALMPMSVGINDMWLQLIVCTSATNFVIVSNL